MAPTSLAFPQQDLPQRKKPRQVKSTVTGEGLPPTKARRTGKGKERAHSQSQVPPSTHQAPLAPVPPATSSTLALRSRPDAPWTPASPTPTPALASPDFTHILFPPSASHAPSAPDPPIIVRPPLLPPSAPPLIPPPVPASTAALPTAIAPSPDISSTCSIVGDEELFTELFGTPSPSNIHPVESCLHKAATQQTESTSSSVLNLSPRSSRSATSSTNFPPPSPLQFADARSCNDDRKIRTFAFGIRPCEPGQSSAPLPGPSNSRHPTTPMEEIGGVPLIPSGKRHFKKTTWKKGDKATNKKRGG